VTKLNNISDSSTVCTVLPKYISTLQVLYEHRQLDDNKSVWIAVYYQ